MKPKETGDAGENLAAQRYMAAGYRLLAQNHRTRLGEVDLILEKDGVLVFCEVKTRSTGALDAPAAWVDAKKQRRVMLAALDWVQKQGLAEPLMRFDVAEVYLGGGEPKVHIIEDAFTA